MYIRDDTSIATGNVPFGLGAAKGVTKFNGRPLPLYPAILPKSKTGLQPLLTSEVANLVSPKSQEAHRNPIETGHSIIEELEADTGHIRLSK